MTILWNMLALLATTSAFGDGQLRPPHKEAKDLAETNRPDTGSPAIASSPLSRGVTHFTLKNGLKVIVQSDKRLPIVTAIVIYNVGSKNEQAGQFGYSHLFEHLMIDGSEHWNQGALRSLYDLGGTNINATATNDRTIFYETFPHAALDRVLFLEADRMGYLTGALTADRVSREVGVVISEKRQKGNAPFGEADEAILADIYPPDHPYHHSPIGTESDLNAVTVDAARKWFDTYYGPSNATLVLTGDVGPDEARMLVEKYFAALTPRLPVDRLLTRTVPLPGPVRREMHSAVPQARIYVSWIAPPAGTPAIANLDLIAYIMAAGSRARLNRQLVEQQHIAKSAMVTFDEGLLSSRMGFAIDGIPPDRVADVEHATKAELAALIANGPTPAELETARNARINYMFGLQSSTFSQAFLLMRGATMTDDPDYADTYLRQLREATVDSVRRTAEEVYGRPGDTLIVSPIPSLSPVAGGYDLAKGPPPIGPADAFAFPAVERTRLSNGLEVVLVPRSGSLTADLLLRLDSGSASAPRPVATIAMDMLAGCGATAEQRAFGARAEALGGRLNDTVNLDHADLALSVLTANLAPGVALFADLLIHPDLSQDALTALRNARVSNLQGEMTNIGALADRALRNATYGQGHPYNTGVSTAADIRATDTVDMATIRAWDRGHVRPDHATLYVAADTTMAALRPLLEKTLGGWRSEGPAAPVAPIPTAKPVAAPSLTVIDRPGEKQTFILAGRLLPPGTAANDLALDTANEVYGGNFTSRIGTNLRQDHGWTYGIGSGADDARGQRFWRIGGKVDGAHTGAAIAELIREMRALTGDHPPEQAELDRIANASASQTAGSLEANADVLKAMADSEVYGLPYDTVVHKPAKLKALTVAEVRRAAAILSDPQTMHWALVGDWQNIRGQLTGLGLGIPVVIEPGS